MSDLTESRQPIDDLQLTQEALDESRKQLGVIIQSAMDAIITTDEEQRIVMFNRAAEKMFGRPAEEALGQHLERFIPDRYRAAHAEQVRFFGETGGTSRKMGMLGEIRGLRADGEEVPLEAAISRVEIGGKKFYTAILRDISERRRAEELFRRAVESAPSGILMIDEHGRILLVNQEAERLFGYARDEMLGQLVETLIPGRFREAHPAYQESFRECPSKRGMGQGRDLYGLRKDGTEFPVEVGLNPIPTPSGVQVLAAVVDITERKLAEQKQQEYMRELERSNAELEQFAYVASHDLQEPLRMVASYTELLAERYQGQLEGDAHKYIGYAVDGARRMQRLIHDLLAYARVSSQGRRLQATESSAVLAGVVATMSQAIESARAEVICGTLPAVMADEGQLGQVFQNLVGNALKFHGERRPRIEISARRSGDVWQFCVADNGIGIAKEGAGRIFQMFQRLHTREEYEGTGIGLAISKRIVERHGGKIWFESSPGESTAFYFTLPRVEKGSHGDAYSSAAGRG